MLWNPATLLKKLRKKKKELRKPLAAAELQVAEIEDNQMAIYCC